MTDPFESPKSNINPDSGETKKTGNRKGILAIRLYLYGYLGAIIIFFALSLLSFFAPGLFAHLDRLAITFYVLLSFHLAGLVTSTINLFRKQTNKWIVITGFVLNLGIPILAYLDN